MTSSLYVGVVDSMKAEGYNVPGVDISAPPSLFPNLMSKSFGVDGSGSIGRWRRADMSRRPPSENELLVG